MNKIIFQIGILAFFVSAVIFGVQEFSLFDTIVRAFVVFMAVELIGTAVVLVMAYLQSKHSQDEDKPTKDGKATHTVANNQ